MPFFVHREKYFLIVPPSPVRLVRLVRSTGPFATSLGAATAGVGTALTGLHVTCFAFFCAPVADLGAQLTDLLGERAVASDRVCGQSADCCALNAAGRTVIGTALAHHVSETVATFGRTVIAGGDAVLGVLIQMMTHVVSPSVKNRAIGRARNASLSMRLNVS